jgi:hypothetical protein
MFARFSETRLERGLDILRLLDKAGNVLLKLRGTEIDDAIQAGFVDLGDCHSSMFDYARMRWQLAASQRIFALENRARSLEKASEVPVSTPGHR